MAAPRKLTDEWIADAPFASGRPIVIPDAALPGMRLVIRRRNKIFEIQRERPSKFGKRRTHVVKVGRHPAMTLAQARAKAGALLSRIDAGLDPRTPEKPDAGALTLAQAWQAYEAHLVARPASPMTLVAYRGSFAMLAEIHDTPLKLLSEDPSIAMRLHAALAVRKPVEGMLKRYRGGAVIAIAAMRFLRACYGFAQKKLVRGLPVEMPTSSLTLVGPAPNQPAMSSDDLPGWYAQLQTIDNPILKEMVWFMLLSGLRRRDCAEARWDEIDHKRRVLRRPKPKGGTTRAFDLPLSREMISCLARARRAGQALHPGAPWVWPADSASGHIMEIKSTALSHNGHALRRSYATIATEAGVPEEIISRLLNHSAGRSVTKKYVITSAMLKFLRTTQQQISTHIVAAARA
jgi:integrase